MHHIASVTLGGFLVVVSILHFVVPSRVEGLVPEWWPARRATVYLSGLVELVCGLGILVPETRPEAGLMAALMFVGYVGVHADDLRHARTATNFFGTVVGVIARTLTNVVYVCWAIYVVISS